MRKPSNNDMENIAEDAETAFWAVVAKAGKKYGATSGDMDPGAAFKFEHECMAAVKIWFEYNLNESTQTDTTTDSIKSFAAFIELSEADLTAQVITDYIWGRKGATIGDKVLNLLFKAGPDGAPATRASAIAARLKNAGYTDKQVGIIRDVATQSMKAAIDQVKTAKKLIGDVVTTNQDSFGVYQFRHILVDNKDIKEAMVNAEKLMHLKIQKLQKELTIAGN